MKTKQENIRLLNKLIKAESSISDLWLALDEDKSAFAHIDVNEIISDIHLIRDKLAKAISWEIIFDKSNVFDEDNNNE